MHCSLILSDVRFSGKFMRMLFRLMVGMFVMRDTRTVNEKM